ncbi:MAG: hypothetical protein ABIO83_07920 [Ilumatobacteraceae bacterium]
MRSPRPSDIVLGAASGVIGMLAMDVLMWRRARRDGSDDRFVEWEFSTGTAFDSYESAGAPAQVGLRLARLGGVELPVERAGLVTDVVHWATGVGWGVASGALVATTPVPALPAGVVGGVTAVVVAYGALGAAGIYDPVWEYDAATLWQDVSAHLVFGATTGIALWAVRSLRP